MADLRGSKIKDLYQKLITLGDNGVMEDGKGALVFDYQTIVDGQQRGFIGYATKADMDADTSKDDQTVAMVGNDSTAANNGFYRFDSSVPEWVKLDDFYQNTLDPAGTAEAVTGKAVGDYLASKIMATLDPADTSEAVSGKAVRDYAKTNIGDLDAFQWVKYTDKVYTEDGAVSWAIVDDSGNIALAVMESGNIISYSDNFTGTVLGLQNSSVTVLQQANTPFALTDENGGVIILANKDGSVSIPNQDFGNEIDGVPIQSTANIVCIGDSLTDGDSADTELGRYPDQLAELTGRDIVNAGEAGQIGYEIASRFGALPIRVTVSGGSIPVSGSVNISIDTDYDFLRSFVDNQIFATINGVRGIVRRPAGGTEFSTQYTFTRMSLGIAVATSGSVDCFVDTSDFQKRIPVVWVGRNDVGAADNVHRIITSNKAIVSHLSTLKKKFVVMSVINASSEPDTSSEYAAIIEANRLLAKEYYGNYIDIRSILATESDGTIPASLRSDSLHLNDAGYLKVAQEIEKFIISKQW